MKFRRQRLDDVTVNLTPLIDVVFLLLIFFMVSTTFTRETQLSVDLPEAQGQVKENLSEQIEILIDESGGYRVNGQGLVDNRMRTLQAAIYKISAGIPPCRWLSRLMRRRPIRMWCVPWMQRDKWDSFT